MRTATKDDMKAKAVSNQIERLAKESEAIANHLHDLASKWQAILKVNEEAAIIRAIIQDAANLLRMTDAKDSPAIRALIMLAERLK